MASRQLFEGYIEYILDEFDAGFEPDQILHALHSCGFKHLQLPTIVEFLKQQQQLIPSENQPTHASIRQFTPKATSAITSQTNHANTLQTPPPHDSFTLLPVVQANSSQTHHSNTRQIKTPRDSSSLPPAAVDAYTSQTHHSNGQQTRDTSTPPPAGVHARAFHWDTEADQFSLAAYLAGQEIGQIKAQLCRHGYVVTSADVAASLISQGVEQNLRPWANPAPTFRWDFQT